jgi:flagellar protein FlaG
MTDLNINAKLPGLDAVNGFVRENLVKPLQNSQKAESKEGTELEKRQEIATQKAPSDIIKDMPREELDETISQLNDSLQNVQRNLEFSIDKEIGQIVINVKDRETDEIVRQIPSEEVLELAKNLHAASERFNERINAHSQSTTEGVFLRTSV